MCKPRSLEKPLPTSSPTYNTTDLSGVSNPGMDSQIVVDIVILAIVVVPLLAFLIDKAMKKRKLLPPTKRCRPKLPCSATPSKPSPSSQRNWSRSSAGWRELNVTILKQSTISGYLSCLSCHQLARTRFRRQVQPRSSPRSLPTSPTKRTQTCQPKRSPKNPPVYPN